MQVSDIFTGSLREPHPDCSASEIEMGRSAQHMRQPTRAEASEKWISTNPRDLAHEIATFMGSSWPARPVRRVQLSLDGAPTDCEELMVLTQLNPTLLWEMSLQTRELFLEVYHDDIQDAYSEVMDTLCNASPDGVHGQRVTYDSLRKFKHLTVSLGFQAVSHVCQAAFDHPETDFDEWPEVAPDHRPGCWCTLDVARFTELAAASTALVKMILDNKGELPPAAEARVVHTDKRFYYEDV